MRGLIFLCFCLISVPLFSQINLPVSKKAIKIESEPSGAKVYAKEKDRWLLLGTTPVITQINPENKELKFVKDGYEDTYAHFNAKDTVEFWIRLIKLPLPKIWVNTDVQNAEVFLDDHRVGKSRKTIEVEKKGNYRLKVKKEYFKEREMDIELLEVKTYRYNFELKYKVAYLNLIPQEIESRYNFLSEEFPNAFRKNLEKADFVGQSPSLEQSVIDIYDRERMIELGKSLGSDLLVCGSYKQLNNDIFSKIELTVIVYDIESGEKVIQKRIIGGGDSAVYVMVNEAGEMIKSEVIDFEKNRLEAISRAREEREKLEKLSVEEKRKQEEEYLQLIKIKTQLNDSQYLRTHTVKAAQFKYFFWTKFSSYSQAVILDHTNVTTALGRIGKTNKEGSYTNILSNLTLFFGLGKNIDIGIELGSYIARTVNMKLINYAPVSSQPSKIFDSAYFNPNYFIKWKPLQDENHGINLALKLGYQPNMGQNYFGNSIFHTLATSNLTGYHLGLFTSKTIGNFTPFFDFNYTLNKLDTGNWRTSTLSGTEWVTSGFEKSSDAYFSQFILKLGTEIRFNSWFIIQPSALYAYTSDFAMIQPVASVSGYYLHWNFKPFSYTGLNLTTIFSFGKGFSLSTAFGYAWFSDWNFSFKQYKGSTPDTFGTNDGQVVFADYHFKTTKSYGIWVYVTGVFDF